MHIQVFADESGGKGHSENFTLVGLMADAEDWFQFSIEWEQCLREAPAVRGAFKMSHAARLKGAFNRWSQDQRDEKLRSLARIINRHVGCVLYCNMHLPAHAAIWEPMGIPNSDVWVGAFNSFVLGTCFELWDAGLRAPYEIIFDENVIFGPRAKRHFPVMREVVRIKEPETYSILPVEPIFEKDENCPPLQAADLFAYCIRHNTDNPAHPIFEWLLDELRNVKGSEYSSHYDAERMRKVKEDSYRNLRTGLPSSLSDVWRQIYDSRKP